MVRHSYLTDCIQTPGKVTVAVTSVWPSVSNEVTMFVAFARKGHVAVFTRMRVPWFQIETVDVGIHAASREFQFPERAFNKFM